VFRVKSSVIEQSLVLSHPVVKRDIIIFLPSSKWVEKENWVLETLLDELLSGIFKKQAMAIMKRVSNLECVDSISSSLISNFLDLSWQKSVLVQVIIILDSLGESHFGS
jgi:hypothetical protein